MRMWFDKPEKKHKNYSMQFTQCAEHGRAIRLANHTLQQREKNDRHLPKHCQQGATVGSTAVCQSIVCLLSMYVTYTALSPLTNKTCNREILQRDCLTNESVT